MNYIFEITWFVWFLSEIFLNRLFQSKTNKSNDLDKNSLRFIWLSIFLSITLGVLSSIYFKVPILNSGLVNLSGLVFIILGIIVRLIAIKTLGAFFTVDLAVHDNHHLVNTGMYKYVRHPSYSGSLLSFLGFGLCFNNWISLAVILIPVFISFWYRICVEENLLEQNKLEYTDYKKHTKRLIPFIY